MHLTRDHLARRTQISALESDVTATDNKTDPKDTKTNGKDAKNYTGADRRTGAERRLNTSAFIGKDRRDPKNERRLKAAESSEPLAFTFIKVTGPAALPCVIDGGADKGDFGSSTNVFRGEEFIATVCDDCSTALGDLTREGHAHTPSATGGFGGKDFKQPAASKKAQDDALKAQSDAAKANADAAAQAAAARRSHNVTSPLAGSDQAALAEKNR